MRKRIRWGMPRCRYVTPASRWMLTLERASGTFEKREEVDAKSRFSFSHTNHRTFNRLTRAIIAIVSNISRATGNSKYDNAELGIGGRFRHRGVSIREVGIV